VFFAGYVILAYQMFEHLIMLPCLLELQILLSPLKMSRNSHQDIYVTLYKNVRVIPFASEKWSVTMRNDVFKMP